MSADSTGLVVERLGLVYGTGDARVDALTDVSLQLNAGDYLALRGPSGSGKTSLLHCLGGLRQPTTGQVRWQGRRLDSLQLETRIGVRGTDFAYLFQGGNLLPTFTVAENIAFAARLAGHTADNGPAGLLDKLQLEAKGEALPDELSGGEQQRVALARALAQKALVLLADEPTGQLDNETAIHVLDLIDEVRRAQPELIVVLATHDAAVARRCDRVLEIVDGQVTATA